MVLPLEILNNNPTLANDTTIADPPELMKGSAMPVKGISPVMTAIFSRA
jgi:hypothetical protein